MKNIKLILAIGVLILAIGYYLYSALLIPTPFDSPQVFNEIPISQTTTSTSERIIISVDVKKGSIDVVEGKVIRKDGVIEITDNNGKATSLTATDSGEITIQTLTSPTKKHLFYTWGIGDGGNGFIYDVNTGTTHALGVISGVKEFKWLEDGKFDYYVGCVTNECYHYISTSSDSPWVTSLVQ